MPVLVPERLYHDGRFRAGWAVEYDVPDGRIRRVGPVEEVVREARSPGSGSGGGGADRRSGVESDGGGAGRAPSDAADDDSATHARDVEHLPGRALLPGFVNAHSHAFQRLIRGRTQWKPTSRPDADFWSWRESMYAAALSLSPDDVFDVSRFCFLEMLLAGYTSVGEFHYLHRDPDGRAYADPNELAHRVIAAAADVGIRIALLNVCYATGDIGEELRPEQRRFATPTLDGYLADTQALLDARSDASAEAPGTGSGDGEPDAADATAGASDASGAGPPQPPDSGPGLVTVGVAPHSVRAVPREWLGELHAWAAERDLPFHIHVSEQLAEVERCESAYGLRPVELLAEHDTVDDRLTAVHATHLAEHELAVLGDSGAVVCACPTTERDLGDGFLPGQALLDAGAEIALGSDSHTVIDPFEEMRLVEYHERLRQRRRVVLAVPDGRGRLEVAPLLSQMGTEAGARSLRLDVGRLERGRLADFVAVDLHHPALAGWTPDSLGASLALSAPPDVVRDVWVGGVRRIERRRHAKIDDVTNAFLRVAGR